MSKIILHIDFDSFFASCEQQFNPKFRNKPIGVTATNGRTCIIASSREAKRLGIKTGARAYEAKKICPQMVFIPAHFEEYLKISKKFLNICKNYSPFVELFSIDEVFMDVTATNHLFNGVSDIVSEIKNHIRIEIGEFITVSIGISHNKLLAKLASSLDKPNGVSQIKFLDIDRIYASSKLTDICGIGERIKLRLNKIGVYTLLDLRKTCISKLLREFGKAEAHFLKRVGLALDESPIISYTTPPLVKSVGRNYCLPKNEYDNKVVLQNIYELCEEVSIKLRRLNKKARTLGLSLRGSSDFHFRKTCKDYFDKGKEIFELCISNFNKDTPYQLLEGVSLKKEYVRQISVWVCSLEDKDKLPLSLFESSKKTASLTKVIDSINERFGDHTIRNGFLLYADKLTTVPNGYMADKYERQKISEEANQFL